MMRKVKRRWLAPILLFKIGVFLFTSVPVQASCLTEIKEFAEWKEKCDLACLGSWLTLFLATPVAINFCRIRDEKENNLNQCVNREAQNFRDTLDKIRVQKESGLGLVIDIRTEVSEVKKDLQQSALEKKKDLNLHQLREYRKITALDDAYSLHLIRLHSTFERSKRYLQEMEDFQRDEAQKRIQILELTRSAMLETDLKAIRVSYYRWKQLLNEEEIRSDRLFHESENLIKLQRVHQTHFDKRTQSHQDIIQSQAFVVPSLPKGWMQKLEEVQAYLRKRRSEYTKIKASYMQKLTQRQEFLASAELQKWQESTALKEAKHQMDVQFLKNINELISKLKDLERQNNPQEKTLSRRKLTQRYQVYQNIIDYTSICDELNVSSTIETHLYTGCHYLKIARLQAKQFFDQKSWLEMAVSIFNWGKVPDFLKPKIEELRFLKSKRTPGTLGQAILLHDSILNQLTQVQNQGGV